MTSATRKESFVQPCHQSCLYGGYEWNKQFPLHSTVFLGNATILLLCKYKLQCTVPAYKARVSTARPLKVRMSSYQFNTCFQNGWPPLLSSGQSSWLQSGDVLCFLWGTNWIDVCYVEESRPPLWSSGQSSWLQSGDVLCFLWGTNWIYVCYVEESRPPLWSSGQSSWLQSGDVLCFLWGVNWIYVCYVEKSRPPL
jgi:hypothetical protein